MLEMKGIDKRFGAVVALNKASLTVENGQIAALAGSNGSGKSTMVKVLAGLVAPNAGEIFIDGDKKIIHSGTDAARENIATAFQDLSLIPTMSVKDNILLGCEICTKSGMVDEKTSRQQVQELLDRFHIDCDPDDYVQTLMPSTQSMLEVAKAVFRKPKILLLDEVTASLHYDEIETLFGIMRELKAEGISMVYVTHRMNEIFEICDTITIMRSSETVISGQVSEFTLDDIIYYMTGSRPKHAQARESDLSHLDDREVVVNVKDISVYPKVKDISMKAYRGEIVGIGGLEGQGQPEVIRSILGAVKPQSGSIEFMGKTVKFKDPAAGVKAGIGFISGDRNKEAIFDVRTIAENIFAGNSAKESLFAYLSARKVRKFSEDAVKKYNIKIGKLKDPASSLSGGNQQKLVVARWIAMNPNLLLLDDPTKGVDIHSRQEIHEILRECAANGMTIIISASDTEELLNISDRIYVFYEGKVAAELAGETKTAEHLVSAMMGVQESGGKEAVE
ncbi:MAG: sugar ABC transporter ATP-binding protein [Parasporobacterium sp.]|nr:sugar ABC transporter ATP-binding protein [Parasporobacterium sp.]